MRNILLSMSIILLIMISGCSQKTQIVSEGYDDTMFDNGFNIVSELRGNELLLKVNNPNQINYKLYFVYKYKCKDRNGYSRERVHEGNDLFYPVLINIPSNENCDQVIRVILRDSKDDLIYETPIMVVKPVECLSNGSSTVIITE
jgi:hypothetical protein